jgi:hypothetical protein
MRCGARLPQVHPDFARERQPEEALTVADLADESYAVLELGTRGQR